tara:strand:+ start:1636 stop:1833 length:198 start_codon:yes stop_codon:yes gene_type:complete
MNDANYKLTTVKVLSENYSKFKLKTIDSSMTLQKLVNRAIEKYLKDEDFEKKLDGVKIFDNDTKY